MSVPLAEHLLSSYIYVVGTVRTNRAEFPTEVAKAKLKNRGDMVWRSKNSQILAMKWLDTTEVTLLSTMHGPTLVAREEPESNPSRAGPSHIPTAVRDYRRIMQRVDRHDPFSSMYAFDHKSMKWWHPLFFDMLHRCLVNAWVWMGVCRDDKRRKDDHGLKDFLLSVAEDFCGTISVRKQRRSDGLPRARDGFFDLSHVIDRLDHRSGLLCAFCRRSKSVYYCPDCDAALHVDCFRSYHNEL